jgi:DNA modification methylase
MDCYRETLEFFSKNSDFKINPVPLIWVKRPWGLLGDYMHEARHIYEACLVGSRGDRLLKASGDDAYVGPIDTSDHPSAKPEPMLSHFFPMFVNENTMMLDPTCGGGTSLIAAEALGAPYVLGIEKKEKYVKSASRGLERARQARRAKGNGQAINDPPTLPTPTPS